MSFLCDYSRFFSTIFIAHAFSEDLKWRIVYLYYDVLQIYVQWETVVNPWQKLPGYRKTLTRNEIKIIILQELVKDKVDWYLDELVGELELQTGKLVSIPILWRSLVSTFIAKIGRDYKPEQLILMDEATKDERSLSQGYGYSLKNIFATKKNIFVQKTQYTILPALSLQGIITVDIIESNCTKERFKKFVISNIVPQMNVYPNEQVFLYLIIHKFTMMKSGHVEFLSPYSPDFNPIETYFSIIKSFIKRYKDFVNSCNDSRYPLLIAYSQITPQMAERFFKVNSSPSSDDSSNLIKNSSRDGTGCLRKDNIFDGELGELFVIALCIEVVKLVVAANVLTLLDCEKMGKLVFMYYL
ncbi:homeodomain-like protein [Rhizophagus clarus]|uniref:Homeodomain-like protein n=1 Tax=Rhizophagus clarus TaxID=94130 RepID=A0A8H3LRR5_9GLOM|nr:homeodomain-like protein [Rhizophagus clarus]